MSEYPAPLLFDPYQGMPKLECPATELNRSRRGETLNAVLQNPESTSWKSDGPKRAAVDRAVLGVREKSSFALRECMGDGVEPPPTLSPEGRPPTKTAMMEMRREKAMAENAAIGASSRSSLPIGNQPGAPGKNPEYKRFTHHDVDMMKRDRT